MGKCIGEFKFKVNNNLTRFDLNKGYFLVRSTLLNSESSVVVELETVVYTKSNLRCLENGTKRIPEDSIISLSAWYSRYARMDSSDFTAKLIFSNRLQAFTVVLKI